MKHSAITRRVLQRLWIRILFEVVHLAFFQEALRKASQRRPGSSSIGLQAFQEQSPPSWFAIQEGSLFGTLGFRSCGRRIPCGRNSAKPGRGCVVLDRPARRVRAGSLSAMTAELQVRTIGRLQRMVVGRRESLEEAWPTVLPNSLAPKHLHPAATHARLNTSSGIGWRSCQMMAMGVSPVWRT
jgi:hypothetical protein